MSGNRFHIKSIESAQLIELDLPLSLDSEEFDQLNSSMLSAVRENAAGRWVIDLSRVSYMGSAMLGLMVNLRQQIKGANGKLALCCVPPTLMEIFQTCSLERLFTISKTRNDALRQTK